jgi:hypothetical protein
MDGIVILDLNRSSRVNKLTLNPVFDGEYKWDNLLTQDVKIQDTTAKLTLNVPVKVKLNEDHTVTLTQGDQVIKVQFLGFFKDVSEVFDRMIDSLPEDESMPYWHYALGTTRSLPIVEWD